MSTRTRALLACLPLALLASSSWASPASAAEPTGGGYAVLRIPERAGYVLSAEVLDDGSTATGWPTRYTVTRETTALTWDVGVIFVDMAGEVEVTRELLTKTCDSASLTCSVVRPDAGKGLPGSGPYRGGIKWQSYGDPVLFPYVKATYPAPPAPSPSPSTPAPVSPSPSPPSPSPSATAPGGAPPMTGPGKVATEWTCEASTSTITRCSVTTWETFAPSGPVEVTASSPLPVMEASPVQPSAPEGGPTFCSPSSGAAPSPSASTGTPTPSPSVPGSPSPSPGSDSSETPCVVPVELTDRSAFGVYLFLGGSLLVSVAAFVRREGRALR